MVLLEELQVIQVGNTLKYGLNLEQQVTLPSPFTWDRSWPECQNPLQGLEQTVNLTFSFICQSSVQTLMEVPLSFKQSQEETAFSSNIYPTCNMMVALADPQVNILL